MTLDKILSYLVIFIPITLVSGPLIPEILMLFAIAIFLFKIFKFKKFNYFKNFYTYFFLCFFLYINLRSLFVDEILVSLQSTLFYFRFYLLSLVIWYILDSESQFAKKFLKYFLISIIILISDSILQFNIGTNIFGWEKIHPQRISSFFGDELVLGSYLVRFFPLIIGIYIFINFDEFNLNKTLILFFIILVFFVGISISGDRTAFYLSLLFLPFLINLKKIPYIKNKIFLYGTSFLILLFIFIFTNDALKKRIIESTISSMISKNSEKNESSRIILFSNNHENHIKTAIKIFNDNKLFGIGVKQFRFKCNDQKYFENKHSCSTHPHNIYAQILSELGLIGIIFLMIYFIFICFKIFENIFSKKDSPINLLNLMALSTIFLNLFPFSPSGNFFNNWISMIYFFPIGFYLYSKKKN